MTSEEAFNAKVEYYRHRDRLPMFVIFRPTTRDYPGEWVSRLFLTLPREEVAGVLLRAPSLAEIRAAMPPGTFRMDRQPNDDPVIEEIWI